MKKTLFSLALSSILVFTGLPCSRAQEIKFALMPLHLEYFEDGQSYFTVLGYPAEPMAGDWPEKFNAHYLPMIKKLLEAPIAKYTLDVNWIDTAGMSLQERRDETDFFNGIFAFYPYFRLENRNPIWGPSPVETADAKLPLFANQFADKCSCDYLLYVKVVMTQNGPREGKFPGVVQGDVALHSLMIDGNSGEILFSHMVVAAQKHAGEKYGALVRNNLTEKPWRKSCVKPSPMSSSK